MAIKSSTFGRLKLIGKDAARFVQIMTEDKAIIGFVTLACSEIDLQNGYDLAICSYANNYESCPLLKLLGWPSITATETAALVRC